MTNYVVEPGNEDLLDYAILCHHQIINPNPFLMHLTMPPMPAFAPAPPAPGPGATATGPDVLNLLEASIARQAGAMEQMNTHAENTLTFHKEKETQKKDRFAKLHPSTKQMILFASASDEENVPEELEDTCERFMNATTHGVAEQELSMQLKEQGLGEMAYATGLSLNLYSGRFLYAVRDNPSNLSCFSIHEGTHLDEEEQQDRQLILHLIETKGKGQSIEEIKSLNKQQVKVPTTYTEMMEQLTGFKGLIQIFFGQFSVAYQGISALMNHVKRCKSAFKARERSDQKFCCKFMYAVDTRFQLWLEDCMTATQRNRVDDTILNFRGLIEQVRFGTFELKLPSSFAAPKGKDEPKKDPPPGEAKNPGGKKGGSPGERRINKRVNNTSPCPEFKLEQGEMWANDFANMRVQDRIHWKGDCRMCPRWNICRHCFDNCVNADSHIEANKIPPTKISEFKEFMQLIRNDNAAKRK
jgi:hypothetical protein